MGELSPPPIRRVDHINAIMKIACDRFYAHHDITRTFAANSPPTTHALPNSVPSDDWRPRSPSEHAPVTGPIVPPARERLRTAISVIPGLEVVLVEERANKAGTPLSVIRLQPLRSPRTRAIGTFHASRAHHEAHMGGGGTMAQWAGRLPSSGSKVTSLIPGSGDAAQEDDLGREEKQSKGTITDQCEHIDCLIEPPWYHTIFSTPTVMLAAATDTCVIECTSTCQGPTDAMAPGLLYSNDTEPRGNPCHSSAHTPRAIPSFTPSCGRARHDRMGKHTRRTARRFASRYPRRPVCGRKTQVLAVPCNDEHEFVAPRKEHDEPWGAAPLCQITSISLTPLPPSAEHVRKVVFQLSEAAILPLARCARIKHGAWRAVIGRIP
ncbi:uncharacterized protein LAESUDRAFT_752301 [Laetiporus sulphureus 93-53]|uniref:Uncharacterized protein n=1 Tax=Laetiporus sulphureus 93-53 TaxID=1314785 RepID=A0A165C6C2_9APHY|nr:uncharacterized protein LAESUDRAFT_752301 [Laetiporus sulphureus 93-53]KZT02279.1 hypothetical protein LAESUDRAFT_752301 [Laetiporus sulphureus 93-53]